MELETRLKPHGDHASVTKAARWADDLGFKTFFASEASYEPFLPLVTAAMATERIELGTGIAVAFVATIYGVGLANLFFLPFANKLKARLHSQVKVQEMIIEGIISISQGENPRSIESRLQGFLH